MRGHACRWGHSAVQPQPVQLWEGVSVAAGDMVRSQGGDLGPQCLLHAAGTRIASRTALCLTLSSGASEPLSYGPSCGIPLAKFRTNAYDTY